MSLIDDFDLLYMKYSNILSFSELRFFLRQLASSGYRMRIKCSLGKIHLIPEKPTIKDLFLRFKSYFRNKPLYLLDYQKHIYKL
jgi:hypothetical protein